MRERLKNQQGFTLVEIIIAIALIGIISVALYAGIQFALKTLYASKDYMQKNYAIQADLDEYIGTKDISAASPQDVTFTWESGDVPNFTVSGYRLDKTSSAQYLDETFKAYVSSTITPKQ